MNRIKFPTWQSRIHFLTKITFYLLDIVNAINAVRITVEQGHDENSISNLKKLNYNSINCFHESLIRIESCIFNYLMETRSRAWIIFLR